MNELQNSPDPEAWKKANFLDLAKYFHKWCGDTFQFKRVHHFELEEISQFNDLATITGVNICLALNFGSDNNGFICEPVLEVFHDGVGISPVYLPLVGRESPNGITPPTSALVPGIFKEMILNNWLTIDTGLINDLFIAQKQPTLDDSDEHFQMLRVHFFQIGSTMVNHLNLIRTSNDNNIEGISLYPGVDMNKFQNGKMISFTPVLGIRHLKKIDGVPHFGIIEEKGFETFIEYTSPCPPTCSS